MARKKPTISTAAVVRDRMHPKSVHRLPWVLRTYTVEVGFAVMGGR